MHQEHAILVVDDDEDYCFVAKTILQRSGVGKEVITASNGLEALTLLEQLAAKGKMPGLIFLDLRMPIMDGFEFLEEAIKKEILNFSQVKVYITTSSVLPKDKDKAFTYPIAGFVPKPLNGEVLKEILS